MLNRNIRFYGACFLAILVHMPMQADAPHKSATDRLASAAGQGAGSGLYVSAPVQHLTQSAPPIAIAVADFNGDGKADVAVPLAAPNAVGENFPTIYISNGDGSFRKGITLPVRITGDLLAADLNGDGKPDLVGRDRGSQQIWIALGNGDGTFKTPLAALSAIDAFSIAVGDLNGDGIPDLAVSSNRKNTVQIYSGRGDGSFQLQATLAPSIDFPAQAAQIQIVDINSDGKPDIVVVEDLFNPLTSDELTIFLGDGRGSFRNFPRVTLEPGTNALTIGDVNNDGRPDLVGNSVSTDAYTQTETRTQYVSLNLGGAFTKPVITPGSGTTLMADFDGDGNPDLIFPGATLLVSLGNGDGTFGPVLATSLAGGNALLSQGDVDGDGLADLISFSPDLAVSLVVHPEFGIISSPRGGVSLSTNSLTMTWAAVPGATKYRVNIGSLIQGDTDVFTQETTGTSLAITNRPTYGGRLHVAIYAYVNGAYTFYGAGLYNAYGDPRASSLRFVPIAPCRVVDTRNPEGPFGGPAIVGGATRTFSLPSASCGIPASAQAYSLNVTAVPMGALGFLSIWPAGQPRPEVSTLNSYDGRVKANAAIVPAGIEGAISVFVTDSSHVVIDVNGYFVLSDVNPNALAFYAAPPCRVVDTRNAPGDFGGPTLDANSARTFAVSAGDCPVASNAQAYSMNVTVIPQRPLGYLTAWPAGTAQPYVSTLNAPTGVNTANAAIIPAGTGGSVSAYVTDRSDVVLDTNGWFAPPAGGNALSFYPVTPCRISDTRKSTTPAEEETRIVTPSASGCNIPSNAKAYALHITVLPKSVLNYLTIWPTSALFPSVSTLNSPDGAVTSNAAIVPAGAGGAFTYYVTQSTDVIIDVNGYFAP